MDIAGVYEAQGFKAFLEKSAVPYVSADVFGIEGTHCYCDETAEAEILNAVYGGQGKTWCCGIDGGIPSVRFIGSGDYHYITCLLAQDIKEPFSLVLMDHHRDDQAPALGNVLSCGGWVSELKRRNKNLEEVLIIGPEGRPQDIPEGWIEQRKGKNVYVSLDKDIMGPQYAVTGWSQGKHTVEDVKGMIRKLIESEDLNIIAVDVCGETSPENCQAVNLEANIEILKTIINTLK